MTPCSPCPALAMERDGGNTIPDPLLSARPGEHRLATAMARSLGGDRDVWLKHCCQGNPG